MRSTIVPFAVLALKGYTPADDVTMLDCEGIPHYKRVDGVWHGEHERAYIVPCRTDTMRRVLISLARGNGQSHVLFVREDASAVLHEIATDIDHEHGQWREVPKVIALAAPCYTYDGITGAYYVAN